MYELLNVIKASQQASGVPLYDFRIHKECELVLCVEPVSHLGKISEHLAPRCARDAASAAVGKQRPLAEAQTLDACSLEPHSLL